uniref:Uncharacterized protein n=1 Tax=Arundo donax TaxID=35708 RepID=A0A0A8ZSI5_ARUDO
MHESEVTKGFQTNMVWHIAWQQILFPGNNLPTTL